MIKSEMIQKTLETTKKLVWPEIKKYLKDPAYPPQFALPDKFKSETNLVWKINREYPQRKGKYIRPTLLLLVAKAMGVKEQKAVKAAAAMQISEDWLLIHDDIEDKSDERRGKPCLHNLFGVELAINAGDFLHMIMWRMVHNLGNPKISDEFYKMLMRTAMGQGVEQIWTNEKRKVNEEEYLFVADGKTAYYSVAGPMRLGAMLANATNTQIGKISDLGKHLGRCYQLVDDIFDAEEDRAKGRSTLVTEKGIDFVKKLAEKEKNLARKVFEKDLSFLSRQPARTKLSELIDFILERKY